MSIEKTDPREQLRRVPLGSEITVGRAGQRPVSGLYRGLLPAEQTASGGSVWLTELVEVPVPIEQITGIEIRCRQAARLQRRQAPQIHP